MRPCGLLWDRVGSYGTVWAPYGLLLNRMGTLETVWVRVPIRSHTVFSSTLFLLHIYPPIMRKRSMRCTSSLGSCQPSVYHTKMGNPTKCLSQRHNKYTCRLVLHTVFLMLSVKRGCCEYQLNVIGLTRLEIKPESTAGEADALTTRPSELLNVATSKLKLD